MAIQTQAPNQQQVKQQVANPNSANKPVDIQPQGKSMFKRWWFWLIVAVIIGAGIYYLLFL